MAKYRVVFGGQRIFEATSEQEAYAQFCLWVGEQIFHNNFGLVIEEATEDVEQSLPDTPAFIDLGAEGHVVCDRCNKDYSSSDELGGVLISNRGYGPCCAQQEINLAYQWGRTSQITQRPDGMSFREWMLSLR